MPLLFQMRSALECKGSILPLLISRIFMLQSIIRLRPERKSGGSQFGCHECYHSGLMTVCVVLHVWQQGPLWRIFARRTVSQVAHRGSCSILSNTASYLLSYIATVRPILGTSYLAEPCALLTLPAYRNYGYPSGKSGSCTSSSCSKDRTARC